MGTFHLEAGAESKGDVDGGDKTSHCQSITNHYSPVTDHVGGAKHRRNGRYALRSITRPIHAPQLAAAFRLLPAGPQHRQRDVRKLDHTFSVDQRAVETRPGAVQMTYREFPRDLTANVWGYGWAMNGRLRG